MRTLSELISGERQLSEVAFELIRMDGGTQYRELIDSPTVDDYLGAMKDGEEFPPLDTVFDGRYHWLVDGFHRFHALRRLRIKSIKVRAIKGTLEDARLLALTANAKHGLPRDQATKKRIVLAALAHPAFAQKSSYEIGKLCGVSSPFVTSLRDPEMRERQQLARDRSAANRIKQEVANPINTDASDPSDPSELYGPDLCGPDEEELKAGELALEKDIALMYKMLESDDALKTVVEENRRLNLLLAHLELRMKGLMNEKNEAIDMVKRLQKQVERSQPRNTSPAQTEIRNDH